MADGMRRRDGPLKARNPAIWTIYQTPDVIDNGQFGRVVRSVGLRYSRP